MLLCYKTHLSNAVRKIINKFHSLLSLCLWCQHLLLAMLWPILLNIYHYLLYTHKNVLLISHHVFCLYRGDTGHKATQKKTTYSLFNEWWWWWWWQSNNAASQWSSFVIALLRTQYIFLKKKTININREVSPLLVLSFFILCIFRCTLGELIIFIKPYWLRCKASCE